MTPRADEIRGTLTRDVVSRAMRAGMEHGIDAAIEHLIAALTARPEAAPWPASVVEACQGDPEGAAAYRPEAEPGASPRPSEAGAGFDAEMRLRQEWWANHGCPVSVLYGDDGELQCNALGCMVDFKREPIESLATWMEQRRWQRLGEAMARPALPATGTDAEVIAAIRSELWDALDRPYPGEHRTLVSMLKQLRAERDAARENRRGEFDLRMEAEAKLRAATGTALITPDYLRAMTKSQPLNADAHDALNAAAREIERLRAATGTGAWQPIETAPKDGTHFIGWYADANPPFAGETFFECVLDDSRWRCCSYWVGVPPTHWQPLPPAPTTERG